MLDNYAINSDGVVYQKNIMPFDYNENYSKERYDTYGVLNDYMSYLRLGYVQSWCNIRINSIIDVGYGNGAFLKVAKKYIPNCYGTDISGYPIPEGVTFVKDWANGSYDVITFFDVLEHIENPYFIEKLNTKFIVISLPWFHNHSDEWFMNWKHRREHEHLWFFNPKSVENFATTCGYTMLHYSNIEDVVRGRANNGDENILSAVLRKN